jgi:hypothetical protein
MLKRLGWSLLPILGIAALGLGCGSEYAYRCECVSYQGESMNTYDVYLTGDEDPPVESCNAIPDAYPNRGYDYCYDASNGSIVAPIGLQRTGANELAAISPPRATDIAPDRAAVERYVAGVRNAILGAARAGTGAAHPGAPFAPPTG